MTDQPAPQTVPAASINLPSIAPELIAVEQVSDDVAALCHVGNCYWIHHDVGLDGRCARCGWRFGGGLRLSRTKPDEVAQSQPELALDWCRLVQIGADVNNLVKALCDAEIA